MKIDLDEVERYIDEEEQKIYDEEAEYLRLAQEESEIAHICQECWDPDCLGCN